MAAPYVVCVWGRANQMKKRSEPVCLPHFGSHRYSFYLNRIFFLSLNGMVSWVFVLLSQETCRLQCMPPFSPVSSNVLRDTPVWRLHEYVLMSSKTPGSASGSGATWA